MNLPICALGFLLAALLVNLDAAVTRSFVQKVQSTDWIGAALFLCSITSSLVGLSWGGVQYRWTSLHTLGPIVVGLAGMACFVGWQLVRASNALLPVSVFRRLSAGCAFYCALANGVLVSDPTPTRPPSDALTLAQLFSALYYLPLFYTTVHGSGPARAGIDVLPALVLVVPGSIVTAVLTSRLGRFRWAIWIGWAVTALGCGLVLVPGLRTKYAALSAALAAFGIGSGMVLTSVNVGVQAMSGTEDCAMAASMYTFTRSVGMPIGVVVSGTVFQNAMSSRLSHYGLPTSIARDAEQYAYALKARVLDDAERQLVLDAYSHGFWYVFLAMTIVAVSALFASLWIKHFDMDQALQSEFTARERSSQAAMAERYGRERSAVAV